MNKKKYNNLCCFDVPFFFTFLTVTLLCGSGADGCENLTQMQSLCHPVYVPTGLFMSEPLPSNLLRAFLLKSYLSLHYFSVTCSSFTSLCFQQQPTDLLQKLNTGKDAVIADFL